MRTRVVVAIVIVGCAVIAASVGTAAAATGAGFERRVERIGTTVDGRPITVTVRGRADADIDVLVVGVIHGNETAGVPIVRMLDRALPPRRVRYWTIRELNMDGARRGTRQNARGVDLNRNFPGAWRGGGRPFDTYYPGRRAASEPETRALLALVRRVRPDATVWYHQHANMVIRPNGVWRQALARAYERASGLAMKRYPDTGLCGTAAMWQEREFRRSLALVVELPAGRVPAGSVTRHADAIRRLAIAASLDDVRSP